MVLHPNWKAILGKAWSVRFMAASAVFGSLEQVVPAFDGLLPPKTFAVLSIVAALAGILARVIQQMGLTDAPDAAS